MNSDESQRVLELQIETAGVALDRLSVNQGIGLMFDFYRNFRAEDCREKSCDMLLFQWGTYEGEDTRYFELDLTRQFIVGEAEDENIWQLSLTFKFSPTEDLGKLPAGNKWCPEPRPRALDYFEGFVRGSAAYQAVNGLEPVKVELDYFNAG